MRRRLLGSILWSVVERGIGFVDRVSQELCVSLTAWSDPLWRERTNLIINARSFSCQWLRDANASILRARRYIRLHIKSYCYVVQGYIGSCRVMWCRFAPVQAVLCSERLHRCTYCYVVQACTDARGAMWCRVAPVHAVLCSAGLHRCKRCYVV